MNIFFDRAKVVSLVNERIGESVAVKQQLFEQSGLLAEVAEKMVEAYRAGNKVLLFGNGGSAADAQHIAAELVGRYYLNRRALSAEALSANTASMTAIANDYSYDQIFSRQVEAQGNTGDIAIGISTSGNSLNVIEGMREAKRIGMITVGLTGSVGGTLKKESDFCICIPSNDTPRIQESHILVGHILCEMVELVLFGERSLSAPSGG